MNALTKYGTEIFFTKHSIHENVSWICDIFFNADFVLLEMMQFSRLMLKNIMNKWKSILQNIDVSIDILVVFKLELHILMKMVFMAF